MIKSWTLLSMTTLILVRHGQTDWNLERRMQGQLDVPLNAMGMAQAGSAGFNLAGSHFDAFFSSDSLRTKQTAEIIASALGMPVHYDPRLREIHLGRWQGLTFDEVCSLYPEDLEWWEKDPPDWRVPGGGESREDVANRMKAFADQMAQRYPAGRLLVVSHGMAIGTLVCLALEEPISKAYDFTPDNTGIVQIDWKPR